MDEQYISIKSWAQDERPREKLLQQGVASLSLSELFAILFRSGVGGESALSLARRVLADYQNDLNILAQCEVRELMNNYKGIGIAKASAIIAAMEIGRRRKPEDADAHAIIRFSKDAYDYIRRFMEDLSHEEFWVIYLARSNRIKGCECLSSGGMDGTVVDTRILFRNALHRKAAYILIAHNHPGGTLSPSFYDEMITKKIFESGDLLNIKLYDHIIVGKGGYFSFADEGMLNYRGKVER